MSSQTIPPKWHEASTRLGTESQQSFVALYGGLFEHSPWVARDVWRPDGFADATSMITAMVQIVSKASMIDKLALLCAHPELAGKEAQDSTLTSASEAEQAGAGLNRLSAEELATFKRLNEAYRERHGFPFIVCVRHYTKIGIIAELARRTTRQTNSEMDEALDQVAFIARLRFEQIAASRAEIFEP